MSTTSQDHPLLQGELRLAGRLDGRFFDLLAALALTGSLQKAARAAGYSYKGAWLVLDAASALTHVPLVAASTGGRGGGGSQLTDAGRQLLAAWRQLQARHHEFLHEQERWLAEQPGLNQMLKRMSMKTTARNQFAGTVSAVHAGPSTTQVRLSLGSGDEITASLTQAAAAELGVAVGQEALALVKASEVVLVTDFGGYRLSARNQLAGTVSRVQRGAVSSLVGLTLPGGQVLTASVTNDAVDALGLAPGQAATACFKAYAVMLAVRG
ncbi:MAG: molybdenum transport protein ModE [Roseateles depolymerans]|uniref:Molybdenum transport protein ModE n=1 Tax=Roseateles depolymerans TaxID=76731 RepID=A0A2W5E1H1_9BURK|nr:MAG: molybdenum transport protein ModE [Roseateles depolymerans]